MCKQEVVFFALIKSLILFSKFFIRTSNDENNKNDVSVIGVFIFKYGSNNKVILFITIIVYNNNRVIYYKLLNLVNEYLNLSFRKCMYGIYFLMIINYW